VIRKNAQRLPIVLPTAQGTVLVTGPTLLVLLHRRATGWNIFIDSTVARGIEALPHGKIVISVDGLISKELRIRC
jgi:hypothetical protein